MENKERLIKILTHFLKLKEKMDEIENNDIYFKKTEDVKNNIRRINYLCDTIDDKTVFELKDLSKWLDKQNPPFTNVLYIYYSFTKKSVMNSLYHGYINYHFIEQIKNYIKI